MKLFSTYGFHAVSIRTIAKEVGVESSALYKHFTSKQAIFDAIVQESKTRFLKKYEEMKIPELKTAEDIKDMCIRMFLYQTQDSWVTMFRRMLIIEMFCNDEAAAVYRQIFVDMPLTYQKNIFESLITQGKIAGADPEVMALELYSPFFLYHLVPDDMQKQEPVLRAHVENFIKTYMGDLQ